MNRTATVTIILFLLLVPPATVKDQADYRALLPQYIDRSLMSCPALI